jgi:hypothetical protein
MSAYCVVENRNADRNSKVRERLGQEGFLVSSESVVARGQPFAVKW